MSSALAIIPRSFDDVATMARSYSRSALLPAALRGKEADIIITVLAGLELGIPPMAALRSISVIQGRPAINADALVALALANPACEYIRLVESTPEIARYETMRRGWDSPGEYSYTYEEARAAGLAGKDNWRKYPADMLRARAKSRLVRDAYPDVAAGVYTPEELETHTPAPTNSNVIEAEYSEVEVSPASSYPPPAPASEHSPPSVDTLIAAMRDAESLAELATICSDCGVYGGEDREALRAEYRAAKTRIGGEG